MNAYYAYLRVSTARQSFGTSLSEQRRAIERYAQERGLHITQWFEEIQTAAKCDRPIFHSVIERLRRQQASGLILHKIDRGARNLSDWAKFGELLELGIKVRFAHDNLDMGTRSGRLAADLQAVIAADYIRNLREEARKGFLGRLKQGLYPMPAPCGYQNKGSGKAKVPDPFQAPLIIYAFERYAQGRVSLRALSKELFIRGLVNQHGTELSVGALSHILHSPFYMGLILVAGTSYQGIHQPLISEETFGRVQGVFRLRSPRRRHRQRFRFQRKLRCLSCSYLFVGERHKHYVYYRCHLCRMSFREEVIEEGLSQTQGSVMEIQGRLIGVEGNSHVALLPQTQFESDRASHFPMKNHKFSVKKMAQMSH